jgi:hypothetical protein
MIGSATHGEGPGFTPGPGRVRVAPLDPYGNLAGAFVELGDAVVAIGQGLVEAVTPFMEGLVSAFEELGRQITGTFTATIDLFRILWDAGASRLYAVGCMGIADSDIRAVVLGGHRRCPAPHVWLWNHRRIPFPAGSPPAVAWGSW